MKDLILPAILLFMYSMLTSCASIGVKRIKDITFDKKHQLELDVYTSAKITAPKKVIVFVHGGRWKTGSKSQYKFLGNRLARKGLVAVVVDYRLSGKADYRGMASDVASALKWVRENINSYTGDDRQIFLSGHSAGGHLAALVSTDSRYLDSLGIASPIRGTILIDAFGLDMYAFLSNESFKKNPVYYTVFSSDPRLWKDGSPAYHVSKAMPPTLLFVGGRTYPVIVEGSEEYLKAVTPFYKDTNLITIKKKKHIPMILQFYNSDNRVYNDILRFMETNK